MTCCKTSITSVLSGIACPLLAVKFGKIRIQKTAQIFLLHESWLSENKANEIRHVDKFRAFWSNRPAKHWDHNGGVATDAMAIYDNIVNVFCKYSTENISCLIILNAYLLSRCQCVNSRQNNICAIQTDSPDFVVLRLQFFGVLRILLRSFRSLKTACEQKLDFRLFHRNCSEWGRNSEANQITKFT